MLIALAFTAVRMPPGNALPAPPGNITRLSDEFDGDMLSERGGVLHDRYDWPNIGRGKAERAARGSRAVAPMILGTISSKM